MSDCLVYALRDPRTLEVRYIGKSTRGQTRIAEHLAPRSRDRTYKSNWLRELRRQGLRFIAEVLEVTDLSGLDAVECFWIAQGRGMGWPLTNLHPGGTGGGHNKIVLPQAVSARYRAGESEQAIARDLGVSRAVVARHLSGNGVARRGRSAAMCQRMAGMTTEQRKELAAAANKALRGTKYKRTGFRGARVPDFTGLLGDA